MSGMTQTVKGRDPGGAIVGHDPGRLSIGEHAPAPTGHEPGLLGHRSFFSGFRVDRLSQADRSLSYAVQPNSAALLPANAESIQTVRACARPGVRLHGQIIFSGVDGYGAMTHSAMDVAPDPHMPALSPDVVDDEPCDGDEFYIYFDTPLDGTLTGWCSVRWPRARPLNLRFSGATAAVMQQRPTFVVNDWVVKAQTVEPAPASVMVSYGSARRCGLPAPLPTGQRFLGELCTVSTSMLGRRSGLSICVQRSSMPGDAWLLAYLSGAWHRLGPGAPSLQTTEGPIWLALVR